MGYDAINEPLLSSSSSSAASPDVPPPRYVAVTVPDTDELVLALDVEMNDPASMRAYLTRDLSPPTTWISVRGFMNCDQPNHRTEFRFCVDITPLLVPTDPSGPKVKGWRSAVGEFVYNPARTSPTRRAAILQEHQSLLHDDANADTIVGHPTRPQSDSLGEWAGVDHANEREMAPDAVLGNVARWAGHRNIRLWRTVSLRKRVAWEFKDLSEILGELVRAQNPKWARKPGSRFSLYIEPFAKDNDVTANPPPSDGFKFRAGAAFVIVVVVLVILPGALIAPEIFNPMIMFFIIIGAGFFAALVSKIFEDLMLDARARLSCEYKVGCSVEEFMRRHGAAIMMAAREGRQGVVLKANADSAV